MNKYDRNSASNASTVNCTPTPTTSDDNRPKSHGRGSRILCLFDKTTTTLVSSTSHQQSHIPPVRRCVVCSALHSKTVRPFTLATHSRTCFCVCARTHVIEPDLRILLLQHHTPHIGVHYLLHNPVANQSHKRQ